MNTCKPPQIEWRRQDQPVLSALLTNQAWARVSLYSPVVVRREDGFHMWYLGNSSRTRHADHALGYATSDDGIHWREHPGNPVVVPAQLPFGTALQTPHVHFDRERNLWRMWFVAADATRDQNNRLVRSSQQLAYGQSTDGMHWSFHPEPLYPTLRGPCVITCGSDGYRMWANSAPHPDDDYEELIRHIFGFRSSDGLHWVRDDQPAVVAGGPLQSIVYPFVRRENDIWTMWYGAHVANGFFEIFTSTSRDGRQWTHHHDAAAFPAARDRNRFDGRYTSTPCIVEDEARLLLYYSARDTGTLYRAGDGTLQADGSGIYRHIGVAVANMRQATP